MSKQALAKIPKLKCGNDEKVAEKLRAAIQDAKDGVRRIVAAGLFFEYIDANLEHGELEPWIKTYCTGISRSTYFGWKKLATDLMSSIGVKSATLLDFSVPLHEALLLLPDQLPKKSNRFASKSIARSKEKVIAN